MMKNLRKWRRQFKRKFALLLAALMCLSVLPAANVWAAGEENEKYPVTAAEFAADTLGFSGGSGTQADPYLISSAGGLRYLAQMINSEDTEEYYNKYYALTADIDLGGSEWTPIGIDNSHYFGGYFYGGGHTIRNFTVNAAVAGLFGYTARAKIYNVTIENAIINADGTDSVAGGLIGQDLTVTDGIFSDGPNNEYKAIVDNCRVTGSAITATGSGACAGGLLGNASRRLDITYCSVQDSAVKGDYIAGGVLGRAKISRCTVNIKNSSCTGGTVTGGTRAGGIWGAAADWQGFNDAGGALEGYSLSVTDCLNTSAVATNSGTTYGGGIIGYFYNGNITLRNCLNTGKITKGTAAVSNKDIVGYSSRNPSKTNCFPAAELATAKTKLTGSAWNWDGDTPSLKGCPGGDGCEVVKPTPAPDGPESVSITFRVKNGQWSGKNLKNRTKEYSYPAIDGKLPVSKLPSPVESTVPGHWYGLRDGQVDVFTEEEILGGTYEESTVFIYAYDEKTYTVTFDLRDNSPLTYLAVPAGTAIPADQFPDTSAHETGGYRFNSWIYIAEGVYDSGHCMDARYANWTNEKTVEENIVLYANWTNGGYVYYAGFETGGKADVPCQRFMDPDEVVKPQIEGYTYSKWYHMIYTPQFSGGYETYVPWSELQWNFGNVSAYNWAWANTYLGTDQNNVVWLYGDGISTEKPYKFYGLSKSVVTQEGYESLKAENGHLDGVSLEGVSFPTETEGKISVSVDAAATSVKLLYAITVKGTAGGTFTLTDANTSVVKVVGGTEKNGTYTLGKSGTMILYVVKTHTLSSDTAKVSNTAKITPGSQSELGENVSDTATSEDIEIKRTGQKKLEEITKTRLTALPAGVDNLTIGEGDFSTDTPVILPLTGKVKVLYQITVKGEAGANYIVTDQGATWVGGEGTPQADGTITGTIGEGKTQAVIYVTKEFAKGETVTNTATLTPGPGTQAPEPGKGSATADTGSQDEEEPALEEIAKTRLTALPTGVDNLTIGEGDFSKDETVILPLTGKVKVLYQITVKGEAGANYIVTDQGATWVGGEGTPQADGTITGTIGEGKSQAVIYVTKEFAKGETVTNTATLAPGADTQAPEPGKNSATADTGSQDEKKPTLSVVKKMGDPVIDEEEGTATVDYTVTVVNTSGLDLYGLDIIDTLTATIKSSTADMKIIPVSLTVNEVSVKGFEDETESKVVSGEARIWTAIGRNTPFGKNDKVELKYQLFMENTGDDALDVDLNNTARGGSWKSALIRRMRSMAARNGYDYEVDGEGEASGSIGTGSGTVVIPKPKYTVTYTDGVGGIVFKDQVDKVEKGAATPAFRGSLTREGYLFDGWNPEVSDTVTVKKTVYTAKWIEHQHNYNIIEVLKEPKCEEAGERKLSCSCGASRTEPIPQLNHNYGPWEQERIGEQVNDAQHIHVCANDASHVERANHRFGEWQVRIPATTNQPGLLFRVCGDCGYEQTRTTDQLPVVHTVTYHNPDGTIDPVQVTEGESTTARPLPEGYAGWSTDPNATEPQYRPGDRITPVGNMELYPIRVPVTPEPEPTEPTNPDPGPTEPTTPTPAPDPGTTPTPAPDPGTTPAPAPGPGATTTPAAQPTPAAVTPVEPTPQAEPEEEETTGTQQEEILDNPTPLAEGSQEDITDDKTPLAAAPAPASASRAWALLNLILAICTVLASLVLLFGYLGKKKEEDEEQNLLYEVKRKGMIRLSSLVPAIVAIVVFFLTENMRNPMIIVDRYTWLMAVIALVQAVVVVLAHKKRVEAENSEISE